MHTNRSLPWFSAVLPCLALCLGACSRGGSPPADGSPDAATPGDGGPQDLLPAPDLALPPAEGRPRWGWSYNGGAEAIAAGADGSVFLAGSFGRADFGDGMVSSRGASDVYLVKYDGAGRRGWARTFGGDYADVPHRAAVDKDGNVVVVGYSLRSEDTSSHDAFVARYAADGTQGLFRIYGGPELRKVDTATAVATTADGGIVFTGGIEDVVDFGGGALRPVGTRDMYLVHLGPDGSHRWSRRFGAKSYTQSTALAVAADGDLLLAGTGSHPLDLGDGPGTDTTIDTFVARFSPQGALRWARRFASRSAGIQSVAEGPGGAIWIAGNFGGTLDLGGGPLKDSGAGAVFWARLDGAGKHLGSWAIPSGGGFWVFGAAVDSTGQVILGGEIDKDADLGAGPTAPADGRFFLLKRSADGRPRWAHRFGGTSLDRLSDVAVGKDDSVFVAGAELSKDVTLGGVTLHPNGFVLALTP